MVSTPVISVIIPIHTIDHKLPAIRNALSLAKHPIQLIVVLNNPRLTNLITPQASNELVVATPRRGRGFAFLEGFARVTGDITMLLHSDTIPPPAWDTAILNALKDPLVVGGGFSLFYDNSNPFLEFGNWVLNQWFRLSGELYGDRSIFIRSHILKSCLSELEVPLFEDVRLVQCMHRNGRVVLLKERVRTSAGSLRKRGLFAYMGLFILCRIWYALGGSPFQIYNVYYSDVVSELGANDRT